MGEHGWFPELEHFLGIGEGKLIWRLSLKNVGGLLAGLFLGPRIAAILGLQGFWVLLVTIVAIAIGIWSTTQHNGMVRVRRLWLVLRFLALRLLGQQTIDAASVYTTVDETIPRIRVRARTGGTVMATGSVRARDRASAPDTRRNGVPHEHA